MVFRADAAFANPEIYKVLEKRGVKYAIRMLDRICAGLKKPLPCGRGSVTVAPDSTELVTELRPRGSGFAGTSRSFAPETS